MPFIFKNTLLKENNNTFFKDFLKTQIERLAVKKKNLYNFDIFLILA